MKKALLGLLIASTSGAVFAQQVPYATVKSVEGLVTVTSGNLFTNATANMALLQGAQVLSTSSGTATVVFASGCTVTVRPGQSLLVQETACTALLAQGSGAVAPDIFTPTNMLLGAVGLGLLYDQTRGRGQGAVVIPPSEPGPPVVVLPPVANRPVSGS
jgi:hypothetical protein